MNVAAIMPCRGRADQTVANVRRLLATAGYADWELIAVGSSGDFQSLVSLERDVKDARLRVIAHNEVKRLTYWQALAYATERTDAPLLCNLANDLIPVGPWLRRVVETYVATFGTGDGMVGINGDGHSVEHSCHFLISRGLLDRYDGWPVWYDHNYGDTELCQRAIADQLYGKSPWSILAHDHPYFGGVDDSVYAEGRAGEARDRALFEERKRLGWPAMREAVHV